MFGKKALDFLAIGDITTDAFIRLEEANVHCDINREHCMLSMRFADKIPYEFVEVVRAVGNAPNAAVSAARLGLKTGLVTNLGDDENGRECLAELKKEGVDASLSTIHKGAKTNYHYVLWYEDERTILIKHELYTYRLPKIEPPPRFIYLSSFRGTDEYRANIIGYLKAHPEVRLAFQPGKAEIALGTQKLRELYARTEIFFCNKEEAEKILETAEASMQKLLTGVARLGPRLVVITDGPKGAYFYDGKGAYFMPPYPDPKAPYERTGAGDAYASTFVGALALGKTPEEALQWAGVNSMSVVQQIGAQKGLLTQKDISQFFEKRSANYCLEKLKE